MNEAFRDIVDMFEEFCLEREILDPLERESALAIFSEYHEPDSDEMVELWSVV